MIALLVPAMLGSNFLHTSFTNRFKATERFFARWDISSHPFFVWQWLAHGSGVVSLLDSSQLQILVGFFSSVFKSFHISIFWSLGSVLNAIYNSIENWFLFDGFYLSSPSLCDSGTIEKCTGDGLRKYFHISRWINLMYWLRKVIFNNTVWLTRTQQKLRRDHLLQQSQFEELIKWKHSIVDQPQ